MSRVVTINRYFLEQERHHPEATGDFTTLLSQLALAAKVISYHVNKAGLLDVLGETGEVNVQGEEVQKLDELANRTVVRALEHTGLLCGMASEEISEPIPIPERYPRGKYLLVFDPLDGSSNIDANVSIGTIFGIFRHTAPGEDATRQDFLQPGRELVAAGYVIYGSSTMMVFSTGNGVQGFTLDPSYGEFLLSHPDIRIPDRVRVLSANEIYRPRWKPAVTRYLDEVRSRPAERYRKVTSRYIGSLVADFHRNLLYGGVFLYPEDDKSPRGKLRLLYEAAPLAFLARHAGGDATTGTERILDIIPTDLHQRVPLILGNLSEVERYEQIVGESEPVEVS